MGSRDSSAAGPRGRSSVGATPSAARAPDRTKPLRSALRVFPTTSRAARGRTPEKTGRAASGSRKTRAAIPTERPRNVQRAASARRREYSESSPPRTRNSLRRTLSPRDARNATASTAAPAAARATQKIAMIVCQSMRPFYHNRQWTTEGISRSPQCRGDILLFRSSCDSRPHFVDCRRRFQCRSRVFLGLGTFRIDGESILCRSNVRLVSVSAT